MIKLYQFPISHYCEKVRWVLDYKGLDYKVENVLPGLHIKKIKKIAPGSSVPVLQNDDEIIQGSSQIIEYLERQFPEPSLIPTDESERNEAQEWEAFLDDDLGVEVRRSVYYILLDYPEIVSPFFTQGGPWYGKLYMKMIFPKLRAKMRYAMKINDETAVESKKVLSNAVDRLYARYENNDYLVGNQFSQADIAAAALLAPLCMPEKYPLEWPKDIPDDLKQLMSEFQGKTDWVLRLYKKHR